MPRRRFEGFITRIIQATGYSTILFHDPTGQKLLYAGGVLIILGGLIIRKIVDVQV